MSGFLGSAKGKLDGAKDKASKTAGQIRDRITGDAAKEAERKAQEAWAQAVLRELRLAPTRTDEVTPKAAAAEFREAGRAGRRKLKRRRDMARAEVARIGALLHGFDVMEDGDRVDALMEDLFAAERDAADAEVELRDFRRNSRRELRQRVERFDRLEQAIAGDLAAEAAAAKALRDAQDSGGTVPVRADPAAFKAFQAAVERLRGQIADYGEDYYETRYTLPDGSELSETLPALGTREQVLLNAMLSTAVLLFRDAAGGDPKPAMDKLEAVRAKIGALIAARTGTSIALGTADIDGTGRTDAGHGPRIDRILQDAAGEVNRLREALIAKPADALEADRRAAVADLVAARAAIDALPAAADLEPDWIFDELHRRNRAALDALEGRTARLAGARETIAALCARAAEIGRVLRVNGAGTEADRLEAAVTAALGRSDVDPIIGALGKAVAAADRAAIAARAAALRKAKVDPLAVSRDIAALKKDLDALFLHNPVTGKVVTQSDRRTQASKERIDPLKSVPRETVEHLKLSIRAAELLAASGSGEAAAEASAALAELTALMADVKAEAGKHFSETFFDTLGRLIPAWRERLSNKDLVKLYELPDRKRLLDRWDALEAACKTQPFEKSRETYRALRADTLAHIRKCHAVGATRKAMLGKLKDEEARLDRLWKIIGRHALDPVPDVNLLPLTDQARKIRAKLDERTEAAMYEAGPMLDRLRDEAEALNAVLDGIGAGKKRDEAAAQRMQALNDAMLKACLQEVRARDADRSKQLASKKAYGRIARRLGKDIKSLVKQLGKRRMDPTEAMALERRLKGERSRVKASETYASGMAALAEIETELGRLKAELGGAGQIASGDALKQARQAARAARKLHAAVQAFVPAVKDAGDLSVYPKGEARLKRIADALARAIPAEQAKTLPGLVRIVVNGDEAKAKRLDARRSALGIVRELKLAVESHPGMAAFRRQPFVDAAALGALRLSLPRLELALLTAIHTGPGA
ncbi:hypothetical protein LNKW23_33920 [Paralimibaculum aggregatum]|uniref:DUF349 domain-containing protein n=1 Tax=Paralimibaculum aggregatum TaxID=3036245 RepID=A0ABQ6LQZ2_9RHOB|nr:hypothetical protein [Limibaculum sp. NKW23]GMG84178.1 hypothetical protein LNKW23_33920 [Limibaculum sp. NKW23]